MADSSDIEGALIQKLGSDATLLGICVNGVYPDIADDGMDRFVIVSLIDEVDEQMLGRRAFEDALFLVEARVRSNTNANIKAAAARIDALLEDTTLTVAGYCTMTVHREKRVRLTEVDELDKSIRWYRRGGEYRVVMST